MKKYLVFLLAGLVLGGCAENKKMPPTGERIAFSSSELSVGTKIQKFNIVLGKAQSFSNWGQSAFNASHHMPQANLSDKLKFLWDKNIGKGVNSDRLTLAEPIVYNQVIYALDTAFTLSATDLASGKKIWEKELELSCEDLAIQSVGLAYHNSFIFAIGGDGSIYALNTKGEIIWKKNLKTSLRSEPVIYDNTLYLLAGNNKLFALSTKDGSEKWSYQTTPNQTNLLGMGSPAIHNDKLIVGFSTGEVMAFNALTGALLWTQNVLSARTYNKILDLAHILASPVIENDTVYIIGNSRKIAAFNINNGQEVFDNTLSGHSTPALSGNTLFVIVDKNNLVAMNKHNGKVAWETSLSNSEEETWKGPLLIREHALVVSNTGKVALVDLKTGQLTKTFKIDATSTYPIIADNKVIFLTDEADLVVYEG